jgi:hypothetical protein
MVTWCISRETVGCCCMKQGSVAHTHTHGWDAGWRKGISERRELGWEIMGANFVVYPSPLLASLIHYPDPQIPAVVGFLVAKGSWNRMRSRQRKGRISKRLWGGATKEVWEFSDSKDGVNRGQCLQLQGKQAAEARGCDPRAVRWCMHFCSLTLPKIEDRSRHSLFLC